MGRKRHVGITTGEARQACRIALLVVAAAACASAGCRARERGAGGGKAAARAIADGGSPDLLPPEPPPPAVLIAPPTGDPRRVRIAIDGEPQSLNPDLDPDLWSFRIAWDAIYEPLIRPRPNGSGSASGEFDPVLAERFSVEGEGSRILFYLRPGVTFSDGAPCTAFDVAFTFDRLRAGKTHAPRTQVSLADIERIEVVNKELVRFVMKRPSAYALSAIADIGILPEHVFAKGDINYHPANRHPVGTGPLKLVEWERGKRITLARNELYRGEPAAADAIEIEIQSDAVKALGRAKRGELDALARIPWAYVPEQLDSPSLKARFEVVRAPTSRFAFVAWNTLHPPLNDPAVRRAISIGLDRRRLLEDARHGVGRPIVSLPVDVAPPPPRSDVAAAQGLLDQVGLMKGPGGYRLRGPGRPIRITLLLPTGSKEAEVAAKRVAESMGKLGLLTEVVAGDFGTIMLRLRKGAFDGVLLEWAARDGDDLSPLFRGRVGAYNFGGFASREVDQILDVLRRPDQAEGAPRGEARLKARQKLAAVLQLEQPALFLYAPDVVWLYGRRLRPARLVDGFFLLRDLGPR